MTENQGNQGRMRLGRPTLTAPTRCERASQHQQATVVLPLAHDKESSASVRRHSWGRDHRVVRPMIRMKQLHPRSQLLRSPPVDLFLGRSMSSLLILFGEHVVLHVWEREVYILSFLYLIFELILYYIFLTHLIMLYFVFNMSMIVLNV